MLESPHEVTALAYNPANPDVLLGGCFNGQLVVWDTAGTVGAAGGAASAASASGGTRGGRGASLAASPPDELGEREAATPVIRHKHLSAVEHSHTTTVCDVCWLPGLEADRNGRVHALRPDSSASGGGGSGATQSLARSTTLGAGALAATGSSVPREACLFASLAPDGKVRRAALL